MTNLTTSPSSTPIRIGFIGLGNVGQGVWRQLSENGERLGQRLGARLEPYRAAVRDLSRGREIDIPAEALTTDAMSIATDPKVDIVCELMGGTGLAREVTEAALRAGKVVVTANKALICEHGAALFEIARETGSHYFFEASVGGGIPIIKVLREGLIANRFRSIYGILNGTCNYILSRMENEGVDFEPIVADARRLGYVEADESLDLDGWDTAHKAVILTFLAYGLWVPLDQVQVGGIREVRLDDIKAARELGYRIKLLAMIDHLEGGAGIGLQVQPALVPLDNPLAAVNDVYNGAVIEGDVAGRMLLTGRGAGPDATASAVISDLADAVVALRGGPPPVVSEEDAGYYEALGSDLHLASAEAVPTSAYLRMAVEDRPGALAEISKTLATAGISIQTVLQKPAGDGEAQLTLTTDTTTEARLAHLREHLAQLECLRGEPFVLRLARS